MRGLNFFTAMHLLVSAVFCGNAVVGYVGTMYIEGGAPFSTIFPVMVTVPWMVTAFLLIVRK